MYLLKLKQTNHITTPYLLLYEIWKTKAMLATMTLGADGVQVGSRFVASNESSAHINFKQKVVETGDGGTRLTLKELTPVRLIRNDFYQQIQDAYAKGITPDGLKSLLGRGRAKKGMFEGDMKEGELEIGQVAGLIHEIKPAADIVDEIVQEYKEAKHAMSNAKFNWV